MCLEPTDLLLKCLAAAKAKDWPRFIILVHDAHSAQARGELLASLPEGLPV
jgi:hypothetical protein